MFFYALIFTHILKLAFKLIIFSLLIQMSVQMLYSNSLWGIIFFLLGDKDSCRSIN